MSRLGKVVELKPFWLAFPQKTFATDTEPIAAKMIFGEDAQELVVR